MLSCGVLNSQRKWVQDCTAIKNPLNLSVAQFFCDEAAAAAAGSAVTGPGPAARFNSLAHGPAAGSGQPTEVTEHPLPVQCPSPVRL